ncbi:MAG TPA: TonB family protein [Chthoniobacterales bacterium]|jgi:TonB family protein
MPRDKRFWLNVALVTVGHLALVLALARGSRDAVPPNLQSVVWMNNEAAAAEAKPTPEPAALETPAETPKPETAATPAAMAKSEIQLPSPTPTATATATVAPKPSPTRTPKSSPKPSAKPTPKPTPKKSVEPKATPKPSKAPDNTEKKKPAAEKKEPSASSNQSPAKSDTPGKGTGNANTPASEFAWYGTMLHDRFHKAWEQPTSIVASGAKMSTIVKIRIEKDGRVSKFAIVKPSGNVVVDESVAAIAQRVTQVDPLPEGLAKKGFYEVKIDFELNAEK